MKSRGQTIKKLQLFFKKNYLIIFFCLIIFLVSSFILFKLLTKDEKTIYVKVKVSQGLWWASTLKPSIWLADSIKKGDTELSLSGQPIVEILEVRRYPLGLNNINEQYDVYFIAKMKVGYNEKTQKYTFKRSNITVGSPVEFEFQQTLVTGTITKISQQPLKDNYEEKIVTLQKEFAQESEYNTLQIGDTYFDGEDIMLELIDKKIVESYGTINSFSNNLPVVSGQRVTITATVKMLLKKDQNMLIFKEEFPIGTGKRITLPLSKSLLYEFLISDIKSVSD